MNLKEFSAEMSNFKYTYDVKFPSQATTLKFVQMTAGNRKNLSKYGIDKSVNGFTNYQLAKLSLLKNLSQNQLNEDLVTDVDFVSMLAGVHLYNYFDPLVIEITCGKCNSNFSKKINFSKILENSDKYKFKKVTFKKKSEMSGKEYEFELSNPKIIDIISLESTSSGEEGTFDILYNLLYIQGLKVNGEIIDDFAQAPLNERIEALEKIEGSIIFGVDSVSEFAELEFAKLGPDCLFEKIICPTCSIELEGVADTDSFFTI